MLGGWELIEKLGASGNAEVWKVSKGANVAALKALRKVNLESYKRFRNEISVLKTLGNIDGIIPLIDSDLPPQLGTRLPWYTMPLAKTCNIFLKSKNPKDEEFIKLGATLKFLHQNSIAHRDIKLANILELNTFSTAPNR